MVTEKSVITNIREKKKHVFAEIFRFITDNTKTSNSTNVFCKIFCFFINVEINQFTLVRYRQ